MTKASVWLATGFGGPEVLSRAEADVAPPGPGRRLTKATRSRAA